MSDDLVDDYAELHAMLERIAERTSDVCSEVEVAQLAITHEHAVRKMGSVGLQRVLDVSDRDAYRAVQCAKLDEFVAQRLRIPNPRRRLRQVTELSRLHAMTGEKLPARCPETADAMADGALAHEHVDAVLDVMAKVPAATPPEVRDLAEKQLAEIARHHSPKDIKRAGMRILQHLDPDGDLPSDHPTTRALFEVLLAAWAKPGMNNPDDDQSPRGGADAEGIDTEVLKEAASRDCRTQVQRNHDALNALLRAAADGGLYGASHRGLPPVVIVSITQSQLRERAGIGHTATGTDLPMSEIVTLAAQAQMHLAVFDDITGEPLFYGRSRRLASEVQRFVMFAEYGGCSKPGCPRPFSHVEAHHAEQDWAKGGSTDATHMAPACGPHNRAVHDGPGGWQTVKIHDGPDRGKCGWIANGTSDPPRTNHLHRPDRILEKHAPPEPEWSDIKHRLELILAETTAVQPIWVHDVRTLPGPGLRLAFDPRGLP